MEETRLTPRPMPIEEAEIIERVKSGETEDYAILVERYQDRVFNACWRICGHLEDARDLTQDAFLRALERISEFRHESGFYTWIFRVAVNLTLTHKRRSTRHRTVSLERETDIGETQARRLTAASVVDDDLPPERSCSDAERHQSVVTALQELDADQRAVVVLRDIEGLDYREIGHILEIPPGTVKSRLFRARSAMRDALVSSRADSEQEVRLDD